jgi:membrane protease YdiL (CAAX protease family)
MVALLLPALISLGASYLFSLIGGTAIDFSRFAPVGSVLIVILLFTTVNGIGEELGWRGFALPHLQSRYNALTSSVILGLFWELWHLPQFFVEGTAQFASRVALGFWAGLVLLIVWAISISVTFTWVLNHTRGSTWVAAVYHAAVNAWFGYFQFHSADPKAAVLGITLWSTALWLALAAALILIVGPMHLSHHVERQQA